MIEDLSEEDFLDILIAAEAIDGIIVGGQALNLWADALLSYDDYESLGPFTSKDIDFWGAKAAAEGLAASLNGKIAIPNAWDLGPSEAAVLVTFGGRDHQIDFLHSVCGLDTKELRHRAQELDNQQGVTATLLHPIDVLKSREAGVRVLRRTDDGAIRQLKASPVIALRFIEILLDRGDIDAAQDAVKEVIELGISPKIDDSYTLYGFDPLALVDPLADRPEWHEKFAEFQIRQACARGMERRKKRISEARRRLNHRPGSTGP